ncbi:hypothetical protein BASA82_000711 [Batrachochytrium salamandrivorans]|uniref:DNA replication complex GINS protein PSF2 n=1 Tax=Batrachochytrium salamandrivorans TaxID=1357716 RepID=A0ABQ8FCZ8_9FUNG|nr:hypothetical protein BASA60_011422 [Batrachochytrium salamandrivorans]KAH6567867.1 hypothetical protein BASA62_005828 [Batrachochytrium salamandrivorans]KAH6589902.1 hypothetical protein BASA61_005444 [Batrachochytrium salamandrivorans]KAH6594715.1 hypothetical protein BASA50_006391 [Batrachochytrium salamandrivorans]KAH9262262.1 hypothetical protein BASA82_000711 [Batrachochytrium salamandrivorans]
MDALVAAEFLAENEHIYILPRESMNAMQLVTATYGPFRPLFRTSVPLWLALTFKAKDKCAIVPPEWMEPVHLQEMMTQEKTQVEFSSLPFHYVEIASALLESAADDIPHAEHIRQLLCDLREIRETKIRAGLEALDGQYLQMNHLGSVELETVRSTFSLAFNTLREFS